MDEMVLMQAGDGKSVWAPFGLLDRSKVLREMCRRIRPSYVSGQDKDRDNGNEVDNLLPMHGIRSIEVLLKVLLWAEFHMEDEVPAWVTNEKPVSAYEMELQVHDWDKEFLREKIEFVCALMDAADYLDIPWLYKLAAYKISLHCRRSKEAANSLQEYRDNIHRMAMFEWTGETSEQAVTKVQPEKAAIIDISHRVHLVVINCAFVHHG